MNASGLFNVESLLVDVLPSHCVLENGCDRESLLEPARIDRLEVEHQYQLAFLAAFWKRFGRNGF